MTKPIVYTQADRDVLVIRIRELETKLEMARQNYTGAVNDADHFEELAQAERTKREEAEQRLSEIGRYADWLLDKPAHRKRGWRGGFSDASIGIGINLQAKLEGQKDTALLRPMGARR